jgi:hypothetical protein
MAFGWFALNEDRPPFAFAGMWAEFQGDRGTKSKPIPGPHLVYGFLTTATSIGTWSSTLGPTSLPRPPDMIRNTKTLT